tara:strand:+ start:3682 stop:3927 length:246 start_codon:yes stop_codon:yes gene_type:complete
MEIINFHISHIWRLQMPTYEVLVWKDSRQTVTYKATVEADNEEDAKTAAEESARDGKAQEYSSIDVYDETFEASDNITKIG